LFSASRLNAQTKQLAGNSIQPSFSQLRSSRIILTFPSLQYLFVQGENARLSAFVGAIAIADLVKTTLGPKGMDKILQSVSFRRNA
jgi:hypothetical protein